MATIVKADTGWKVEGDMTLSNVQALLAASSAFAEPNVPNPFLIDLSGVTEVDTASISLMFEWLRAAKAKRQAIAFIHLPSNLVSLATVYGVLGLLPVATTH